MTLFSLDRFGLMKCLISRHHYVAGIEPKDNLGCVLSKAL